jgi:RecB family endonuclease NucS
MIEHLVAAGVADRFNELGYHFHGISSGNFRVKDEKGETLAEVDVLLENDDCYVAVEVKAKPNMEDILEHINRLKVLHQHFKKHNREKKVIGSLAGAIFADNVKKAATTRGLYPIVQSGDTITIDIPKGFKPRLF